MGEREVEERGGGVRKVRRRDEGEVGGEVGGRKRRGREVGEGEVGEGEVGEREVGEERWGER